MIRLLPLASAAPYACITLWEAFRMREREAGRENLDKAAAAFERQKDLLGRGNTTRRDYDQAEASLRSAQAQLDQAHSDLKVAQDQLAYTELRADADGIITARMAEAGQVVAQAQSMI